MRFALLPLLLAGALPCRAQIPFERFRPIFPPDIISHDTVIRDAARIDPSHVRVEIDNETTRVLRITLDAARQVPVHDDRAGVLVCLTDCRLSFSGGEEVHLRAGQTRWMPEGRRTTRNVGSGTVELLYIESKRLQD
jgi:hypothetical protein